MTTTPAATILVRLKNATSTASESLTVSISGPAYASNSSSTHPTQTTQTIFKYLGDVGNGTATTAKGSPIYIWSTGTAGKATITVTTASGLALGTETVYFAGAVTTIANLSDPLPLTNVRTGNKTLDAWYVSATDAAGMPVIGIVSKFSCVTSDATVIAGCSFTDELDGTYLVTLNSATNSVSGGKANITIRVVDPAVTTSTAYISLTPVAVTTASGLNKVTITTDKASYTPGEQMIVTVSAVDASGNPVYDGLAVPTLTSNKSMVGLTNVAGTFTAGKANSVLYDTDGKTIKNQYRVYAPSAEGDFMISAQYTDAALATQVATVTATVTGTSQDAIDAANEATDAANAATEAADAATAAAQDAQAAVAALATQVASLIAGVRTQLASLSKLIMKIQAKVKA